MYITGSDKIKYTFISNKTLHMQTWNDSLLTHRKQHTHGKAMLKARYFGMFHFFTKVNVCNTNRQTNVMKQNESMKHFQMKT